jgi:hypothetical protein
MALRGEVVPNELNAVMNTVGNGWFDKDWRPTFNIPRDVEAIETYKRLAKYTVPGYTAVHNDEHTDTKTGTVKANIFRPVAPSTRGRGAPSHRSGWRHYPP